MRPRELQTFVVITASLVMLGMAPPEDLATLRSTVFDLRLSLLQAEALRDEIASETKLLDPQDAGQGTGPAPTAASDSLWDRLLESPEFQEGKTRKALESFLDTAQKEQAATADRWRAAESRSWSFLDQVPALEARLGRKWNVAATDPPEGLLDNSTRWLLILGGATFGLSLALVFHETRDHWRWRLRSLGSRPSLILLALLLAGSGCSGGGRAGAGSGPKDQRQTLTEERATLQKRLAETSRTNHDAEEKLARRQAELRRTGGGWLPTPSGAAQEGLALRLRKAEEDEQRLFRESRATSRATAAIAEEALRANDTLKKDRERLAAFVADGRASARLAAILRVLACGGFLLAALLPLPFVRARRRRRRKVQSDQCPRCLASGSLAVVASDVQDERYPESRHAECGTCRYQFRASYLRLPRLCLPTVGIPTSGKTHWLITAYDQIKNGNVPVRSSVKKMPSLEDVSFDQLLRDTLYQRQAVRGTSRGLPKPLIFHVRDRDPLGPSETMLNLFDFSGELTQLSIDQDVLKRNALLFDGFFLFLDPTQLTGRGESGQGIEDQIQALTQFTEEMRDVRGVNLPGRKIDVPIAVCITKLDLLTTKNPMAGQAEKWVADLRATRVDRVDLGTIHHRSQLCAEVLPQMFPGWNIERTLKENFGGRFMFFPLTPVGLEASELGVTDLANRTFAPFGVLEPVLWLLHMHGYCVFN